MHSPPKEGVSPAPIGIPASLISHRETDSNYPVLVQVSDKVRVINCKDNLQWIVQRKQGQQWQGVSFCRTREVLIRDARRRFAPDNLPLEALAILQSLPERHP